LSYCFPRRGGWRHLEYDRRRTGPAHTRHAGPAGTFRQIAELIKAQRGLLAKL
jgi:hypothetical protein